MKFRLFRISRAILLEHSIALTLAWLVFLILSNRFPSVEMFELFLATARIFILVLCPLITAASAYMWWQRLVDVVYEVERWDSGWVHKLIITREIEE